MQRTVTAQSLLVRAAMAGGRPVAGLSPGAPGRGRSTGWRPPTSLSASLLHIALGDLALNDGHELGQAAVDRAPDLRSVHVVVVVAVDVAHLHDGAPEQLRMALAHGRREVTGRLGDDLAVTQFEYANPRALMIGDPISRDAALRAAALIDGSSNLQMVAKHVKSRLVQTKPERRDF